MTLCITTSYTNKYISLTAISAIVPYFPLAVLLFVNMWNKSRNLYKMFDFSRAAAGVVHT